MTLYKGMKRLQNDAPLDARRSASWSGGASFPLRNRLRRVVFSAAWKLLAAWTPPQARRWRIWLLRRFGATIAPTSNVYSSARIWLPENLVMHEYATIGPRTTIYSMGQITLGRYSIVSQGAHLCAGTHDIEDSAFQLFARPIKIGERAWIAAEAFIGPGVTIGDGAVVGARACAMRDVAPWTVNSGNPAVFIRDRLIRFQD